MTLKQFIKSNQHEIDREITRVAPIDNLNYNERRLWVLNYENLYLWAKKEGVRI